MQKIKNKNYLNFTEIYCTNVGRTNTFVLGRRRKQKR